jgi:hypothetical protein
MTTKDKIALGVVLSGFWVLVIIAGGQLRVALRADQASAPKTRFSVQRFDSLLSAELWPILSKDGVFRRYETTPTGGSVTLVVGNDWYALGYGQKKDMTGGLWNAVRQLHTKAGARPDAPCHLYIEDQWGETLAEGSYFSGVKIKQ